MNREYWMEFKRDGRGELNLTIAPKDLDQNEEKSLLDKIANLLQGDGWKEKL